MTGIVGTESSRNAWARGEIVELAALLLGVPAGIGAILMIVAYYKKFKRHKRERNIIENAGEIAWSNIAPGGDGTRAETGGRTVFRIHVDDDAVPYPRPVLLPVMRNTVRSWPPDGRRSGSGALVNRDSETGFNSRRSGFLPDVSSQNTQRRQESDDHIRVYRDEVDAHVARERRDWADELV